VIECVVIRRDGIEFKHLAVMMINNSCFLLEGLRRTM
jgi:hypothetical protein